ncbi:hypothetical protein ACWG0P_07025 [Amedibacillus sp. YH-ame6]
MKTNDFVRVLSEILKIAEPKMDHDESYFETDTQMACVMLPEKTIYIRKGNVSYDLFFAIAHEMRHIWQYDYKKYDFDSYINNSSNDTEKYNNQDMEIDAHAFAILIMMKMLKVQPNLEAIFNKDILLKIEKRMNEIDSEESLKFD